MTWLAWRQFRSQVAIAGLAAAAACIVLLVTRADVASVGNAHELSSGFEYLPLLGTGLVGVPAFIGAFWGAPLLAREFEAGTYRLVWSQSVTRDRWLAVKLALALVATVVLVGAFSAAFTWWSLPLDEFGNRIGTANFGQRGIVPVAYAIFALSLGTFFGAILRRTLPAMAATLASFFVVRFVFQTALRSHLVAITTVTRPTMLFERPHATSEATGAWVLSSRTVDASGRALTGAQVDRLVAHTCHLTRTSTGADFARCADQQGIRDIARIHPASQFWALQAWESAIFVSLAALLTVAVFWLIKKRAA